MQCELAHTWAEISSSVRCSRKERRTLVIHGKSCCFGREIGSSARATGVGAGFTCAQIPMPSPNKWRTWCGHMQAPIRGGHSSAKARRAVQVGAGHGPAEVPDARRRARQWCTLREQERQLQAQVVILRTPLPRAVGCARPSSDGNIAVLRQTIPAMGPPMSEISKNLVSPDGFEWPTHPLFELGSSEQPSM
jgi:hypothetical protein